MKKTALPPEDQLTVLRRRARVAVDADRSGMTVKPATIESLVDCTRLLRRLLDAARRELKANNCWCANWPDPRSRCSWCQLKALAESVDD